MVDLTDASGYRLRLLFICSNGGTRYHTCEIEDSRCGGEVIRLWRRAAQSHNIPGAELGELVVATLPRGRVEPQLRRVLNIISHLSRELARARPCRAGRALG